MVKYEEALSGRHYCEVMTMGMMQIRDNVVAAKPAEGTVVATLTDEEAATSPRSR